MIKFINPAGGGTARTIKANYWKVSLSNFVHKDGMGATAVMRVYENNNRRLCVPLAPERTGAESDGGVSHDWRRSAQRGGAENKSCI